MKCSFCDSRDDRMVVSDHLSNLTHRAAICFECVKLANAVAARRARTGHLVYLEGRA